MLIVVAMKQRQDLVAVRGIIGGIQVENDMPRTFASRPHEPLHQEVVHDADAVIACRLLFQKDVADCFPPSFWE